MVEREEGGRWHLVVVERKDGGRLGVVEHATIVRARWRRHDVAVERKVRAEIFVFLAIHEMGAIIRLIVLDRSGGHRGPLMQAYGRTDALPTAFPLVERSPAPPVGRQKRSSLVWQC